MWIALASIPVFPPWGKAMLVKTAMLHSVVAEPSAVRPLDLPQVAFAGRSNVGKSSLINALLGRKKLALTSSTPGKTRKIFFYLVNNSVLFVDLPGYGYARVSRKERARFRPLVERYFEGGGNIRACVLLLDPRRPVGEDEILFVHYLNEMGIPPVVVLTKWDKVKPSQRMPTLTARIGEFAGKVRRVWCSSATTRDGVKELWDELDVRLFGNEGERVLENDNRDA